MPIATRTKSGIVVKLCHDAGLQPPDEETAGAIFVEAQRVAEDLGLNDAFHFLRIAVELARWEPYPDVLRKMQGLTLTEPPASLP